MRSVFNLTSIGYCRLKHLIIWKMKRKSGASQLSKMKRFRTSERGKHGTPETKLRIDQSSSDLLSHKRHLCSVPNDNSFLKFLNEDRQKSTTLCDLIVSVSGKEFSAHKVVLAFGSSYFHTRLCKNPATSHITVEDMDDSAFHHLLCFLYTSEFVVSDTEIPFLVEAARVLNMVTAVELLMDQSGSPAASSPRLTEAAGPMEEEAVETGAGQQSPPGSEGVKEQVSAAISCLFCSRTFCYRKSLENHVARSHSMEGQAAHAEVAIETVAVVTTRRSARQRKTPAKFEEWDSDGGGGMEGKPKKKTLNGKAEEVDGGGGAGDEDEDEEGGANEEFSGKDPEEEEEGKRRRAGEETGCGGGTAAEEPVLEEESEEARGGEHDKEPSGAGCQEEGPDSSSSPAPPQPEGTVVAAGDPASLEVAAQSRPIADTSTQSQAYPEGLAPVVIQSSNKKTLQCPKCDKTFDRIGRGLHG